MQEQDILIKEKLAGVIVLYNPDGDVARNIATYIGFLSHLYIIDNSEEPDAELVTSLQKINAGISYHPLGENLGIAKALNTGCFMAREEGYKWILTMDQDSCFENSLFFDLAFSQKYQNTVIIAASYNTIYFNPKPYPDDRFIEVDFVITSGNILNIDRWQITGGFLEKLFIDEVDNEFCLRARNKGFKIIVTKEMFLAHKLGEGFPVKHFISRKAFTLAKHSPLRVYYIVRNNLYIWRKYATSNVNFVLNRIRNIVSLLFKIILYFPQKRLYFHYVFKAVKHSLNGKYGKYVN